jgi:hypothetical protein
MGKVLAAMVAVLLGAAPLAAQEAPWCVKLDVFTRNCAFASHEECVAVARNAISPATGPSSCIRNPQYRPPAAQARPAPGRRNAETPQR